MRFLYIFIATCILSTTTLFAQKDGKTLYKKCRGCHGIDGKYVPFERPHGVLAGRDKVEIELIIRAVKDGSYSGDKLVSIMRKVISSLSKEDITILSEYISKFKK